MTTLERLNLALRGLLELGVVGGLAYWGWWLGGTPLTRVLLAIGAPAFGFGFWGAVDFHQLGAGAEAVRLGQELLVSGAAAVALYATGQHALGWALGLLSGVHHALVYVLGGRLLKR